MRLAYITYGMHVRLIAYRNEESVRIVASSMTNIANWETSASFEAKGPIILVGPAMLRRDFVLEAWEGEEIIGKARGKFTDMLQLNEQTGYFKDVPTPWMLIEYETIRAAKSDNGPGLAPTDIVLLSRKWEEMDQLIVHSAIGDQRLQWWNNEGLQNEEGGARQRITAWSLARGALTDLHASLVAVLSGPQQGEAGFLLWGDDGGIRVSGAMGEIKAAAFLPSLDFFPKRVQKYLKVPPLSVTPRN